MSTASPSAFLLWAILSVIFFAFLIYHLWSYDRFKCLRWSAGRQPGAFKRIMTYSYLISIPLFVLYSVATTVIKYNEGYIFTAAGQLIANPLDQYDLHDRRWIIPLDFVFSVAWALELVTHLEELAFWLYLLHQNSKKAPWFSSWEYRLWYLGSCVAVVGLPLTVLIKREDILTCDAYIFLVGSLGSTGTTLSFLYVLWRFPQFILHVKAEGADPSVVVRLATFYQLNLARVIFRFMFTVPLMVLALDGIIGSTHPINFNLFWADFLMMIAGIGCFVSSAITLLIFFPRSITREAGYKPKPASTVNSPKSAPITPPALARAGFSPSPSQAHTAFSPSPSQAQMYMQAHMPFQPQSPPMMSPSDSGWDGDGDSSSQIDCADIDAGAEHDGDMDADADGAVVPPYAVHQRRAFPHARSSPYLASPPPPTSPRQIRVALRYSGVQGYAGAGVEWGNGYGADGDRGNGYAGMDRGTPRFGMGARTPEVGGRWDCAGTGRTQGRERRTGMGLHPYVTTFTSPIDLAEISSSAYGLAHSM